MVQDPRPSGKYYTKRFMNALGSPNVYTHGAACNLSKESGFTQAIGAANFESDVANSKMTMFIGRSYADAIRPSSVARAAAGARERRAHRAGGSAPEQQHRFRRRVGAHQPWHRPGAHAWPCPTCLSTAASTTSRVSWPANSVGFDEWAAAMAGYTPEWAEGITGHPRRRLSSASGGRVRRGGPRGLHRAELARRLRVLVRELGRDGARALPVQHASGLLEPARRRAVPRPA